MANEHMTRCSTSVSVKEMQIKTTVRYDFISTKIAKIKKQTITNQNPYNEILFSH